MMNGVVKRCWNHQFLNLFLLDQRQHALVMDNFSYSGSNLWIVSFLFCSITLFARKVYLSDGNSDIRLWKPNVKGQFLVNSFYNALADSIERMEGWHNFCAP